MNKFYETHLDSLNEIIIGFPHGSLIVLGSRPAMGKSCLSLSFILELAKKEIPCGILSFELSKERLITKMLGIESQIDPNHVLSIYEKGECKNLNGKDYQRIVCAQNILEGLKIHICDPRDTPSTLDEKLEKFKSLGVKILFIDYLQLIPEFLEDRYSQASCCVQKLKIFSLQNDITVLVNAQLSRKVEERQGHRPYLSDFRDSGCIEEAADICLALLRRSYYDPLDKPGMAEIIVLKNRLGKTGTANATFLNDSGYFANWIPIKQDFINRGVVMGRIPNEAFNSL